MNWVFIIYRTEAERNALYDECFRQLKTRRKKLSWKYNGNREKMDLVLVRVDDNNFRFVECSESLPAPEPVEVWVTHGARHSKAHKAATKQGYKVRML